jgi:ATP-binding cassette subfamily F protein uup
MLLRLDKVSLSYGSRPLLDQASLQLDEGERVALVGRNGEGKSSLLQLLRGVVEPDRGAVWVRPSARLGILDQDINAVEDQPIGALVASGLEGAGLESWQSQQRVAEVLSRLQLDAHARVGALSGGQRRRALLARALVSEPDGLLLDEPTNHLDIDTIEWLERALREYRGALLFVSHDRVFINRLATRILELDRGVLNATAGNYDDYTRAKAQQLQIEREQQALFDKKLAQEEAWIRRGVEARRTRNEGRVRALMALRAERRARRERTGRIDLPQQQGAQSAELVFEAEGLTVELAGRPIVRDFSARIMRGERIGLIGPNGVGKTTLIRALLGELPVSGGRLRTGSRLEVAYYDQERQQLALDESVMQNVAGRNDQVIVNGRARHVAGYLRDFLFRPEQLNTPARALSGGERNRLLLARLFARPANLLVMDEPTNDLDIDTLELLEEYVADFPGTLLLVSHDRAFLDHVVTSLLVFEGDGVVRDFVGGHSDWIRYRQERDTPLPARTAAAAAAPAAPLQPAAAPPAAAGASRRRLAYKEQRELDALPERLQQLETDKQRLEAELADSGLYRGDNRETLHERLQQLAALSAGIEAAYARWTELEQRRAALNG